MSTIGERMRVLRGSSSLREMAEAVGIKYNAWARYEAGGSLPGAEIIEKICRAHAVSADWLLGLSEERGTSAASPPPSTINLEELRETASQLAGQAAELAGTIKKLKKML